VADGGISKQNFEAYIDHLQTGSHWRMHSSMMERWDLESQELPIVWIQSHDLMFILEFTDASICLCRFQDISHYQFHEPDNMLSWHVQ
jgi:hypothetical protein